MNKQTKSKTWHRYSEEELQWLKNNVCTMRYDELAIKFNKKFNLNVTGKTLKGYVSKNKIPHKKWTMPRYVYTDEEVEWLRNNINCYRTYTEVTEEFNKLFNKNKSESNIQDLCSANNIHKEINYGKYGYRHKNQYPLGTEIETDSYTYVKTQMCIGKRFSGYREPYWTIKQKLIYEQHYGKIKDDEMVIFLDGNNKNFDINNLYPVNRRIALQLNNKCWYGNSELTKVMIEVLKADCDLKDMERL